MSRKTNKTNHVLSLLSNGVKAEEEKEVNTEEKNEGKQEIKNEQPSSVSVVKKTENDVAEDIRRSLEKEMEEYEAAVKKAQDSSGKQEESDSESAAQADAAEKEPSVEELSEDTASAKKTAADGSSGKNASEKTTSKRTSKKKASETEQKADDSDTQNEEDNYILVNVMEALVKERAPEYIRQFGVCGCRRCEMAVEAEALSELPAKYVVINRYAISPLINFYRTKFAGRVTVEVAKACMAVKNNPHHGQDAGETGNADEKNEKKA